MRLHPDGTTEKLDRSTSGKIKFLNPKSCCDSWLLPCPRPAKLFQEVDSFSLLRSSVV